MISIAQAHADKKRRLDGSSHLWRPCHLRHAHGLQHGHPVFEFAGVFGGEVGDRGQAGEGPFDELEAESLLEEAVVNLVEEGAAQIDKALRLRALKIKRELMKGDENSGSHCSMISR